MKIKELIPEYTGENIDIVHIRTNSREVGKGDLFLCIKGANVDRHDFIPQAVENGAVFLVTAHDVKTSVPYYVCDPNEIEEELFRRFYHHPERDLKIMGVTGTDGKTTTTTVLQTLIGSGRCGYIGTNGYSCASFHRDTNNTTPGIEEMYRCLSELRDAGCGYVALETSSEAFFHRRLKGFRFASGTITNIDSEHLNTHKTIENYVDCKKQLFRQTEGFSILNSNDKHYEECMEAAACPMTYGYRPEDDLYIKEIGIHPDHTDILFLYRGTPYQVTSPLLGKFNVENLAAALLTAVSLGFPMEDLLDNLPKLDVDGRMQAVRKGQDFYVLVDYAHTPNGLRRLFEFTKTLDIHHSIVVMGQAGRRDASKRKTVGELLVQNCDHVIMTYEDPRDEDISHILDDMCENIQGYTNYERVPDRHEAIRKAIMIANPNDMVMILGKGNETYEKMREGTIYFNDIEEAEKALEERLKKH